MFPSKTFQLQLRPQCFIVDIAAKILTNKLLHGSSYVDRIGHLEKPHDYAGHYLYACMKFAEGSVWEANML